MVEKNNRVGKMPRYKALIVNCMDPRLQGENLIKIASAVGLSSGEYEVLTYAGPSLWVTSPHLEEDANSFWCLLEKVSLNVHRINQVVLVGHSNCGGFALQHGPQELARERELIEASLEDAAQAIRRRFPELNVARVFVSIGLASEKLLPDIEPQVLALVS